jgi:hypothetical protein
VIFEVGWAGAVLTGEQLSICAHVFGPPDY